jgi:hypothetical protein
MACDAKARWIVVSDNRQLILAHHEKGGFGWEIHVPWTNPVLFKKVSTAQNCADQYNGNVMSWRGFVRSQKKQSVL